MARLGQFLKSKTALAILSPLLGFLGGLAALLAQPVFEPYIEERKVDYSVLFQKQAEAFDVLAKSYGNLAAHRILYNSADERFKDVLEDLNAEGVRNWQQARVLIATYGHPDQVRALSGYIDTRWQQGNCAAYIALDVEIYRRFREQLFKGEDQFENEEEEQKILARVVHDCDLNTVQ